MTVMLTILRTTSGWYVEESREDMDEFARHHFNSYHQLCIGMAKIYDVELNKVEGNIRKLTDRSVPDAETDGDD